MKILILVSDIFSTGGIQAYNRKLCDYFSLNSGKYSTAVISLSDRKKHPRPSFESLKIEYCGGAENMFLRKAVFVLRSIFRVILNRPDLLICGHIGFGPISFILAKVIRARYIVLTHGVEVWNVARGKKFFSLMRADMIISVSAYTLDRMVANGIDRSKIRILPNTVDTEKFCPSPKNRDISDLLGLSGKRVLLTVSRLSSGERYKGHEVMLKVMGVLGNEYVWIVIGEGEDLGHIKIRSEELGVEKRIRFVGEADDHALVNYYNTCDVFVMPSKGEGFGIVFLEAMACGKPVIAGNIDGSREALLEGKLGFLVDPDKEGEIISAISEVFERRDRRTDPIFLREQVKNNFEREVFDKKLEGILDIFDQ